MAAFFFRGKPRLDDVPRMLLLTKKKLQNFPGPLTFIVMHKFICFLKLMSHD
jgi:hypothetical protein